MATDTVRTGAVEANGTDLYHEIRGDGPPVVCIVGGGGDAFTFEAIAELLADTYTVVTYDRRGNSRSPRPPGWTRTTTAEQADDCAALIETLGLERPVVFGSSAGGTILVSLIERHVPLIRGAIVHEPGLSAVSPKAAEARALLEKIASDGMTAGGPAAAMERTFRWLLGDELFESVPSDVRSRVRDNGEVLFGVERPGMSSFEPNADALASASIPVHAAYGEDNEGTAAWWEGAAWVSRATGGPLHVFPGGHTAFMDRPAEFTEALRPILESMTQEG